MQTSQWNDKKCLGKERTTSFPLYHFTICVFLSILNHLNSKLELDKELYLSLFISEIIDKQSVKSTVFTASLTLSNNQCEFASVSSILFSSCINMNILYFIRAVQVRECRRLLQRNSCLEMMSTLNAGANNRKMSFYQ